MSTGRAVGEILCKSVAANSASTCFEVMISPPLAGRGPARCVA